MFAFFLPKLCVCVYEHVHVKFRREGEWLNWCEKERKKGAKNTLYDGKDSHK